MMMAEPAPRFLSRKSAAQYIMDEWGLPITAGTLTKMASTGGGPVYQIFGNKAVYEPRNLDEWAQGKLSPPRKSTSGFRQ
jgi:hypothetical protein